MINFDDITRKNKNELAKNSWLSIENINNWNYRSGKTNVLLNLISHQPEIEIIYLYAKDCDEAKYQFWINRCEIVGLKR